jgi:hypothetical protein
MEKYIYIAEGTTRNQQLTQSVSGADQTFVITDGGGLLADVSDLNTDTELFKSGTIECDLTVHGDHAGNFGSHYGTPAVASLVTIHPNALSYDGTNTITVLTKAQDPVFGITMADAHANNDLNVRNAQPLITGDANVFLASRFLGINRKDDNEAIVYFKPQSNNAAGADEKDNITFTFTDGKFKEFCQSFSNMLEDNRNQSGLIVFADIYNGVFYEGNPAGISAVVTDLDT